MRELLLRFGLLVEATRLLLGIDPSAREIDDLDRFLSRLLRSPAGSPVAMVPHPSGSSR